MKNAKVMKYIKTIIFSLMLMTTLWSGLRILDVQAYKQYDDLKVSIETDKYSYKLNDTIETIISVTNESELRLTNVKIESILPDGLIMVDGDGKTSTKTLEAGDTLELTIHSKSVLANDDGQTENESAKNWGWLVFAAVLVLVIAMVIYLIIRKRLKKTNISSVLLGILLLAGIGAAIFSNTAHAENGETVSFQVEKDVRVVDEKYKITFEISYEKEKGEPLSEEAALEAATQKIDFIVNVETGREPVVLQLTDPQIIDSSQERTEERLGEAEGEYWGPDKMEERCFSYIRETIKNTNPDLILITGDIIYGEFDDKGTSLKAFVKFMESFGIPWAPVFGNHDNESTMGADWQCQQFEQAEHCLFKQRELTGNGNYTVGIVQGGKVQRVFFMLDSNGCSKASSESLSNGHTVTSDGFGTDQIEWYTDTAREIKKVSPETKFTFAFHIQLAAFSNAYSKYGFDNATTKENPINIDTHPDKEKQDFGYLGRPLKGPWDYTNTVFEGLKSLGVDSILVGHEHCNSASVVWSDIRFQFGQKSSTYDRANFVESDGTIVGMYCGDINNTRVPIVGGTVMTLSEENGIIENAYIYTVDVD